MDAELKDYLDGMVDVLSERIATVDVNSERRTDALRSEMLAGFQRVDDRLLDISSQLRTLDQRLTRLDARVTQLAAR